MDIFTLFILHFVALPPSSHLHPSHIFHLYSHSLKIFRDPKPFFKHVLYTCVVKVMCGENEGYFIWLQVLESVLIPASRPSHMYVYCDRSCHRHFLFIELADSNSGFRLEACL